MVTDVPPVTAALSGVHKSYRRGPASTPVLQGVDLTLRRGRCVFLVGPSGSGKSTLLAILGCILSPDQGRVEILGREISKLSPPERAALRLRHIGFVFQRFHLIRGLNALENVCVPYRLRDELNSTTVGHAVELMHKVGLGKHVQDDPRQMSSGQCQRVALVRALASGAEVLLADEPTASLDARNGQEVMDLLRELTLAEGKSVVVVTHDRRIFPYADEIYRLDEGRLSTSPEEAALMQTSG